MTFLDMRTILFVYVLTALVCLLVVILLWGQSRSRFGGMTLWVWDFALQTSALILITLRGNIPDILSITVSQALVMIGAYCGYLALLAFSGQKTIQIHNYILLAVLMLVSIYFTYVEPDLAVRGLNTSVGLLIFCFECVWAAFYRAPENMRRLMRGVGGVFAGYCLVNIVRVADFFLFDRAREHFLTTVTFDKLAMIAYLLLFVLLTYALALMVNKRLIGDITLQEEKYSKTFHASVSAINLTRLSDGVITECNKGFKDMVGYEPADVIGKTPTELHLWQNDQDRIRMVKELIAGQMIVNHEFQFRKKTGETITGLMSAQIIAIDNEQHVLSIVTDISDRKRVEEDLLKSEHRFRDTLDNMLEGCQILDYSWRYVYINETAAKHGHLPRNKYIGNKQTDLFPGIEKTHVFELERRCMEQRTSFRIENEFVYPDGSVGWFDLSMQPVPEGIFILSVDITERKSIQMSLQHSEAFLNSIMEQSPHAIWIADDRGTMIRCNPACLEMFRIKEEEVVGKYNIFEDNIVREQGLIPLVTRVFQKGETVRFEISYDTAKLKNVDLSRTIKTVLDATLFPIKNAQGRITNAVIQHVEISERRRVQEEIHRLNLELEQKVTARTKELHDSQLALLNVVDDLNKSSQALSDTNKALETVNRELAAFSYSVSHDLRAPLRSIDGFSAALIEDYGDQLNAEGKNYLERVRRATQTMGQLIDDLLNLSRVTQAELRRQEVDISAIAIRIIQEFRQEQPSRAVTVDIQKGVMLYADEHLMNIVLTNLLGNAWKFTSRSPDAQIKLGIESQGEDSVIFIQDNGAGFNMQYAGKLFGAFQRLHRAQDYPGTGIGLATVQRIINRHGGRIWAQSEAGKGATFYFTIPS